MARTFLVNTEQENSQQGKQEEEQGMLKENYASMQKREKKAFNDTDASDANDANEFGINNPAIDIAFKSGACVFVCVFSCGCHF